MKSTRTAAYWQPRQLAPRLGAVTLLVALLALPAWSQTSLPLHPEETPDTVSSSPSSASRTAAQTAPEPALPPVEVSPDDADSLIGLTIDQVRDSLINQGWYFVVRTPQLVQLEKEARGLDLELSANNSEIIDASLIDLN